LYAFRLDVIIPLLAVLLSGQLALLFAAIYLTGLSRRPEYPAFSLFSLFLAVMMCCTFSFQEAQRGSANELSHDKFMAILALRLQFVGASGTAGALYHVVFCLLRRETVHRRTLIGVDLLTLALMAMAFSNNVIQVPHEIPYARTGINMDGAMSAPLFKFYLAGLVSLVTSALWILSWGLRSLDQQQPDHSEHDAEERDHFDVLARYGQRILAGALVLYATGVIDAGIQLDLGPLRNIDTPFELRFIGLTIFCVQTASVMGIEIKRNELRKATLKEQKDAMSRFAAQRAEDMQHIHHDVGNRVISATAILECALDSARENVPSGQHERDLLAVHEELGAVNRLFTAMLYRAKLEAGEPPEVTWQETIDLPAWTYRLVDTKRQAIESLKRLAVRRSEDPPPDFEFHVETNLGKPEWLADTIALELILTNLLDNAVKYSPDGGKIDVALWEEAGVLCIRVRDEGDGIALEDQVCIFELRDRGSRAFGRITGNGIGLHHVRRLLEEQGGAIRMDSMGIPGQGSAFTLTLPPA
jgi:signal transduction histidine kinase